MKNSIILLALMTICSVSFAQNWKAGVGVQTHTQPFAGALIELENNQVQNEKFETITRMTLSYRNQTEEHKGVSLELHRGFSFQISEGYYFEQTIGLGVLYSFYSEKYWHENEWHNLFYVGSNGRKMDVIPSVSLGFGKQFGGKSGKANNVWIRPKVFFQLPSTLPSHPYFTLQLGYSKTLTR